MSLSFSGETGTWKGFNSIQRVPSKHSGDNVLTQQRKYTLKENTGLYTTVSILPGFCQSLKKKLKKTPWTSSVIMHIHVSKHWGQNAGREATNNGIIQCLTLAGNLLHGVLPVLSSPTSIFAENTATFSNESRCSPYQQITTFPPPQSSLDRGQKCAAYLGFFWEVQYVVHLFRTSAGEELSFSALSANGLPSAETV